MNGEAQSRIRVLRIVLMLILACGLLAGCDYVRPLIEGLPFVGPEPTATMPAPTATPLPTVTPPMEPTETSEPPTPTPEPEPTATEMTGVLDSRYVRDLSIPDGTVMTPGQEFTKSWEIENSGEVPWPEGTELRRVDGPAMGPIESVALAERAVGERAEISVDLEAPADPGTHRSYWQLCLGDTCFGGRFFVEIVVEGE